MNGEFILKLLKDTVEGPVRTSQLSDEPNARYVERNLLKLVKNGLVSRNEDTFETSAKQKLDLAVLAIREGVDVEQVCGAFGWEEFEDFAAFALEQNGFETRKHFRFKFGGKRYEIDVVGLKEPLVLSVECKHWRQSWKKAAIADAVTRQVERTRALVVSFPEPKDRLKLAIWKEANFVPILVTLSDTPLRMRDGVPIVPVFYFNSFLDEMGSHMGELSSFSTVKATRLV